MPWTCWPQTWPHTASSLERHTAARCTRAPGQANARTTGHLGLQRRCYVGAMYVYLVECLQSSPRTGINLFSASSLRRCRFPPGCRLERGFGCRRPLRRGFPPVVGPAPVGRRRRPFPSLACPRAASGYGRGCGGPRRGASKINEERVRTSPVAGRTGRHLRQNLPNPRSLRS